MRQASRLTTVKVSEATKRKLKGWKIEYGARSIDHLLQSFASVGVAQEASSASSGDEGEDDGVEDKRRKINVREPFYSLELLDERLHMLEYYTGFDRAGVELLIRRFSEVSTARPFFPLLPFALEDDLSFASLCCCLSATRR